MNRIAKKFSQLRKQGKKALIVFLTAGDPSFAKNEALVRAFEKDGVDLIELGVPFSDPLADGPVIQASSQRALKKGADLRGILGLVKKVRKNSEIPILLMGYFNPILQYGPAKFIADARSAGVDGVIVPDLPPEEGRELSSFARRKGLDVVYLLAPTSSKARIRLVAHSSRGFIYYVSLTGVTGASAKVSGSLGKTVGRVKKQTRLPVCVGFGVSTPQAARAVSKTADGVIVGSAVVRALFERPKLSVSEFSAKFVRPFARALGKEL